MKLLQRQQFLNGCPLLSQANDSRVAGSDVIFVFVLVIAQGPSHGTHCVTVFASLSRETTFTIAWALQPLLYHTLHFSYSGVFELPVSSNSTCNVTKI